MNTQEDKLKRALLAIKKLKQQIKDTPVPEPIAVVGIGCRYPGGITGVESFWKLLINGVDAVGEVPKNRWNIEQWYDGDQEAVGKMYTREGGFLSDIETFDPEFFSISPREAPSIDPQQRLLLEVAWEAFESAGLTQASLRNSDTGVYVGICGNDYQLKALSDVSKIDAYTILGTAHSSIGGRLSYTFGLKGPNISIDTACSSSLVALHTAVQALRNNECSQAIAGGVNVVLSPEGSVYFSKLKALSPTGRCHTFSSKADGFVRSEGCGLVVLKRLSDARRDGDRIWGLIKGSAVNQDGNSQGFTAPNGPSQQEVIKRALAQAGVEPNQVDYVEAHGTGTLLGDPIEVGALAAVLGAERESDDPLYIGSIKTNIGHAEGAAGIAGVIKTLLSFEHQCIPKNIHFESPNVHIPWEDIPIKVVANHTPWKRNGIPRVAGVSSFGFSGTNAHVVLEEAPRSESEQPAIKLDRKRPFELVVISGRKKEALKSAIENLIQYISDNPATEVADLAYSLATCRTHFQKRQTVVASDRDSLLKSLNTCLQDVGNKGGIDKGKVAFLFTGQGSQYSGMGKVLYDSEPVFKAALDRCAELLMPYLEKNILDVMFKDEYSELLGRTIYTQPALFSLEYALAELWKSVGLQPDVLIGHSVGEVVAGCIAGIFSLEDAVKLIAARGRLMQALPENGAMVSINTSKEIVEGALQAFEKQVSIAAENAPLQQVISGERQTVQAICDKLQAQGIKSKLLDVSHAFHSALMEPVLKEFGDILSEIKFNVPEIPIISNVSGVLSSDQIASKDYWIHHIRTTVQFAKGVKSLEALGITLGVEIGPHPVLTSLAQLGMPEGSTVQWIYSMKKGADDGQVFLQNVGAWYEAGGDVNWKQFYAGRECKRIMLPTYPFQRKRYWLEESVQKDNAERIVDKATEPVIPIAMPQTVENTGGQADASDIILHLKNLVTSILKMGDDEISDTTPLLEIGADSLIVMELLKKIEREFKVKIAVRRIFEDLTTLKLLAEYIASQQTTTHAPDEKVKAAALSAQNGSANNGSYLLLNGSADVNDRYLKLLEEQQRVTNELLHILKKGNRGHGSGANGLLRPQEIAKQNEKPAVSVLPSFGVKEKSGSSDNPRLQAFIDIYCKRTAQSKAFTDKTRPLLADNRASAGFRFSTKEMLYPIVGKTSKGARFKDIDGNEYVDLTMCFGSNIFGHQPDFVTEAIQSQLNDGIQIGPQSYLVNEVADLFTTITGLDRVCFLNTGTEAVMTAIRLARKVTGRNKIVIFNGSYHGHFDGVLGAFDEDTQQIEPVAGGIQPSMVQDLLILDYCDERSLEIIRQEGGDIAAVLVEPVQSRHLEVKPHEFLLQLRALTTELDIPLVFDEMITGFRILPGGAQAYFGIKADIATYGKIAGGGMPIGAIAGDRKYLDAVDGGAWNYGDKSFPEADTTFLAGTFSKHPLTMAAARAVLSRIHQVGADAYKQLNEKTDQLVATLNAFFRDESVPVEVLNFGSLFRFTFQSNLDLLFYHLIRYGVYVWEGRNCFLSFAHTEEDLAQVVSAVKQSIGDMKENGFLSSNGALSKAEPNSSSGVFSLDRLPLNTAQKQLWVLDKMSPEGGQAYIIHTNIELKGSLQRAHLFEAIDEVVADNEALRCCFDEEGSFHKFLDESVHIAEVDLTQWQGKEQHLKLEEHLKSTGGLPFALDKDRLIRFQLYKLGEQLHVLAFQAHHIVCDGLSTILIVEQIAQLYNAKCAGTKALLNKGLSYSESLRIQEQAIRSEEMREHSSFWLDQFKSNRYALNFPFDHVHADEKRYVGASVTRELDKELMDGLKKIAQEKFCTPFMILFSAYATWLHRLCNQQVLVLGFPTTGRSFTEHGMDAVVGYYSHLLPFVSELQDGDTFASFLKRASSQLLSIFEHESFPYSELLQLLGANHREKELITTVFNVDKVQDAPVMTGLEISWMPQESSFTNMDFKMNLTDLGDRFVLECIYSSELFEPGTMERYVGNFVRLLESIANNPNTAISELEILSETEKRSLLQYFNKTAVGFPSVSLVDLFERQVNAMPQSTAVVFENNELSYQEANELSNQLAAYLGDTFDIQTGTNSDCIIAIKLERSQWIPIAILAVLKAGAAFVPIEPDYPSERINFILQDCKAAGVIDKAEIEKFIPNRTAYIKENLKTEILPNQLAYIIYTSGSTGKPKGVAVEHRNMVNYIHWFMESNKTIDLRSSLLLSSYTFDGVYTSVFGTLLYGGTLHVMPQYVVQDPELLLDYISRKQVTFLKITPSYLRLAIQSPSFEHAFINSDKLALIVIGGEAIYAADLRKIAQIRPDIQLMNHYGPTEVTVGMCAYLIPHDALEEFIEIPIIGRPIYNTKVYILDKSKKLAPLGAVGELCVSGDGVARGYINNERLTQERFIANPIVSGERLYCTGDLGRWRPDGTIQLLGRIDEQVKIRGYRIELGEIENALQQHPAVKRAAVTAFKQETGDPALAAYIVSDAEINVAVLRNWLEEYIPSYMVPAYFSRIDAIPLNSSGKVNREKLPSPDQSTVSQDAVPIAPRNENELCLSKIWTQVLKSSAIGIRSNFYELGGDSIKSIQVASLAKQDGYNLRIEDILRYPVLEDMALRMKTAIRKIDQATVEGIVPLSPIQHRFFSNPNIPQKHHYNQSVALVATQKIDKEAICRCLDELVCHHDALRMIFRKEEQQWVQENKGTKHKSYSFNFFDLRQKANAAELMLQRCDSIEASINLGEGPLMKVALFRLDDTDKLVIVIHHLVVDGVSWRILLEDLSSLYRQHLAGLKFTLPEKTDSYKYWAESLLRTAQSRKVIGENSYWKEVLNNQSSSFPVDHAASEENRVSVQAILLDEEATRKLQTQTHRAYKTEMNDVLLASLALTLKQVFNVTRSNVLLEGHGREAIEEDMNVNRTVGWFTVVFPFILDITGAADVLASLVQVKEDLRKVPNKGVVYGLIKYLGTGFESDFEPHVAFNYLGDFGFEDNGNSAGYLFIPEDNYQGRQEAPQNRASASLLDINGMILGGRLKLQVNYRSHYNDDTIERLVHVWRENLNALVSTLASITEVKTTPSDLIFKGLSVPEFSKLNADENISDVYPLSPLQEGLYYHWLSSPDSTMYLIQRSYRLTGSRVKASFIEQAFAWLVERYDILRTRFDHNYATSNLQIVMKSVKLNFTFIELPAKLQEGERSETLASIKKTDRDKSFSLDEGGLIRLTLVSMGTEGYELIWSYHHILMDGWCANILITEFESALEALSDGKPIRAGEVVPYKEYIKWLGTIDRDASLNYWNNYLADYATAAVPPYMLDQKVSKAFTFRQETLELKGQQYERLVALCHKMGVTESVFIQAAWGYLLSRYNNVSDVVFGNVVSGRPKDLQGVNDMVGLFINTIPVRVSFDSHATPAQLLKKVQEEAIEGLSHHYINLSDAQNSSSLGKHLFNHIMEFENYVVREKTATDTVQGFTKSDMESYEHTHYNLAIVVAHKAAQTSVHFNYNAHAFEEGGVSRMCQHLSNIIDFFIQSPDKGLSEAWYITPQEYDHTVVRYNATDVQYPQGTTLADLFLKQMSETPDNIALVYGERRWTYNELCKQASSVSNWLQQGQGVKGKAVPIIAHKGPEQVWAVLGVLMAGGFYVPVNGNWPAHRINNIIQQVKPDVVLVQPIYTGKLEINGAMIKPLDENEFQEAAIQSQAVRTDETDLAYIIFTSGSTGTPKGVMINHRGAVNTINDINARFHCTSSDRVFGISDLSFDLSVYDIFGTLACGAALVLPAETEIHNPAAWLSYIERESVTIWNSVPQLANLLIEEQEGRSKNALASMRLYLMSGDWIPVGLPARMHNYSNAAEIISLGGATEGSIWSIYYPIHDVDSKWKSIPYGYPLGNQEMYVLDACLAPCAIGIAGEIFIGGNGVAKGYFHNPEITARNFFYHPALKRHLYRTGDMGYHHPDGYINFLGRSDGQVKIRGYRIETGEIEARLREHESVLTAVVQAVAPHEQYSREKELVAYIVAKEGYIVSGIREYLERVLPEYMVPQHIILLDRLPLTANGKVDKNALPIIHSGVATDGHQKKAATQTEEMLVSIWSEVLDADRKSIGITQNFFESGGHSIRAIRLISKINKLFSTNVHIKDIFENVTIAEQAKLIDKISSKHFEHIQRVKEQADYELSPAQRRLWVLCQFEDTNIAYNIPAVYEIKGHFNIEALRSAFAKVIERHEILRTVFRVNEAGEVRQVVLNTETTGFDVAYIDLSANPVPKQAVNAAVEAQKVKPFNLATGPLLTATVYRLANDRHVLFFNMHHIISDGWSVGVLISDLSSYYSTDGNVNAGISELPVQYKDYSNWQIRQLSGTALEAHKVYWVQQLSGELPVLELPADHIRPPVQTHHGAKVEQRLPVKTTALLKEWVTNQGGTLFMGVLTGVHALLYRYTAQTDIIIGSPVAGRSHDDLVNQVGLYMNMLPLRVRMEGNENFEQLFAHLRGVTLEAYEHQMYPFDDLIDNINVKRDLSRAALFDVMVDLKYQDHPENKIRFNGVEIVECPASHITSKLDMIFDFTECADDIVFTIEYNTDIYSTARVARMAEHLVSLLDHCLQQPDMPVSHLNYLGEKEKDQLLISFSGSRLAVNSTATLVDLFREQADANPDAIAVVFKDKELTYRDLDVVSNQLAHFLITHYGSQADDRIAIMLERSEWMIIAVLAILKSGQAYVPIDTAYPAARIAYILEDSQCKACINAEMINAFTSDRDQYSAKLPVANLIPQHLAYIIYTSGSTGLPKGVMVEHRNLVNITAAWKDIYDLRPASTNLLQMASISFDVFFGDFCRSLLTGGKMIICPDEVKLDLESLCQLLVQHEISIFEATPGLVLPLMDHIFREDKKIESLKTLIVGSDILDISSYVDLQARFGHEMRVINSYGATEAAIDSTWFESTTMGADSMGNTPIGKPFANTEIYILNDNGAPVPIGITGEIWIGGVGVARGYWQRPDLTKERFVVNPFTKKGNMFRTGDYGRWTAVGVVEFFGRKDDQVKVRGYRIELGEVKAALQNVPGISESVVVTTTAKDKELIAYYKANEKLLSAEIRKSLSVLLPDYMVPSWFVQVDHIPLTPNGKVDAKALPMPSEVRIAGQGTYIAPRNVDERKLVTLWSEVLRLAPEKVGATHNFFELGGHSLKAIRLMTLIQQQFNVRLKLNELFSHVTVEEQARLVAASDKTSFRPIPLATPQDSYPLSSAQRRLWVLCQNEAANKAYNIQGALELEGHLDVSALESAFAHVIERHEILRTVFKAYPDGEVRQVVLQGMPAFKLEQDDLYEDAPYTLDEYLARLGDISFDLSTGPLFKASIIRIAEDKHIFFCIMHHIVSDGWSIEVLIRDIFNYYNSGLQGRVSPLRRLVIQYKDYASWQQKELTQGLLEQDRAYWLEQLSGELPVLTLAGDFPRPKVHTYKGAAISGMFASKDFTAFGELLKANNATLFMGLLSAVYALLYRYTHQDDIIIGVPTAGRAHVDMQDQIGFYVNTLALRARFSSDDTFCTLLEKVRQVSLDAFDHQAYPFDALADELELKRDLSRSMLFDVMVVLQNKDSLADGMSMEGIALSDYRTELVTSKFDWLFNFIETEEGIRYNIEYNTDIYSHGRMQMVLGHLERLLSSISRTPQKKLETLTLLSGKEEQQLITQFNDTAAGYPDDVTILDLFEEQVRERPDDIALVFMNESFTFRELNQQANRFGNYLKEHYDIQPEDKVAVMLDRSPSMIVALLGVLKAGGAYVPIDPEFPKERVDFILEDCEARVLVDASEFDQFSTSQEKYSTRNRKSKLTARNLMYIIYTSGSTGHPKGCMLEHRGVVNRIHWMWQHYGFSHSDVVLQKTTFTFDVSVWEIFMPLAWGCKMVLARKENVYDPEQIIGIVAQQGITCMHFVPSMMSLFVATLEQDPLNLSKLSTLRSIITSGESLPLSLVRRWFHIMNVPVFNLYGPTEASIDVTYYDIYREPAQVLIGKPIANTQIFILHNDQLVPQGAIGEICIAGDGLARGYLKRPELTACVFADNPYQPGNKMYRTGDLGRWLPDGTIEFIGRRDHQVKIRGYRIELGEIETALSKLQYVSETVVVDIATRNDDKELAAYIVSSVTIDVSEVRAALSKALPHYMLPTYFVQLEKMPLTPNGKLDRKALPIPADAEAAQGAAYVPPVNETQTTLVNIWSDVLEREPDRIGIYDNFFEIGGHSLKAVTMLARVEAYFHVKVELFDFFGGADIDNLSKLIEIAEDFEEKPLQSAAGERIDSELTF